MLSTVMPILGTPLFGMRAFSAAFYAIGDVIEFGMYPQSRVTDAETIAELQASLDDSLWKSYGYYSGNVERASALSSSPRVAEPGDYMKYADVALDDELYRAVTFSAYRPRCTFGTPDADNSDQDENGYAVGDVYWFRYEAIRWIVLDPETGLVVSADVLDAQAFRNEITEGGSDWSASAMREFLNGTFLQTAFSAEQRAMILESENRNPSYDTLENEENPDPDGPDTTDLCFPLRYDEANSANLEMTKDYSAHYSYGSDYAKCQGAKTLTDDLGCCAWVTRTADGSGSLKLIMPYADEISDVLSGILYEWFYGIPNGVLGVRPALRIREIEKADAVYTLTYHANGGSGAPQPQTGGRDYYIRPGIPVNAGRHFLGWSKSKKAVSASYASGERIRLTKNTTLYAVWSAGLFSVSYDANGGAFPDGTLFKATSCYAGDRFTVPPEPSREGFVFAGWENLPAYMPANNATYSAVWAKKSGDVFDRYAFANNRDSFISDWSEGRYYVKDEDAAKLYDYIKAYCSDETRAGNLSAALRNGMENSWSGSCFGMAVTSILQHQARIDFVKNFGGGAASLREVPAPADSPDVMSAINYYMVSQYLDFIRFGSTGAIGKTDASAWSDSLRQLVAAAQKGEPFLFNYRYEYTTRVYGKLVTKLKGHAIAALEYAGQADGFYRIAAYDNNYPDADAFILVSQDYQSCELERPDGTAQTVAEIEFYTDMSAFDRIDIDGVNNDMNICFADIHPDAGGAQIALPGDGTFTVDAADGKTLHCVDGVVSGNMPVLSKHMIVSEDETGADTAGMVLLTVPNSAAFTFRSEQDEMEASVLNGALFASAETTDADSVTIRSGGIVVQGDDAAYSMTLASRENTYNSVCVDGVAEDSVSLTYSSDQMILDGADGTTETVTAFSSRTMRTNAYGFEEGYRTVRIQGNGIEGEVDILGQGGDGQYDQNIRKILDLPKIEIADYQKTIRINYGEPLSFTAVTENMPKDAQIVWLNHGHKLDVQGETIDFSAPSCTYRIYDTDSFSHTSALQAVLVQNGRIVASSLVTNVIYCFCHPRIEITSVEEKNGMLTFRSTAADLYDDWTVGWKVNGKVLETEGDTLSIEKPTVYTEICAVILREEQKTVRSSVALQYRADRFRIRTDTASIDVRPAYSTFVPVTLENPDHRPVRLNVNYSNVLNSSDGSSSSMISASYDSEPGGDQTTVTVTGKKSGEGFVTITASDSETKEILDRIVLPVRVSDAFPAEAQKISIRGCGTDEYFYDNMQFSLKAETENIPDVSDTTFRWKVDGQEVDTGRSLHLDETDKDFTVQVSAYFQNRLLAESSVVRFHKKTDDARPKVTIREGPDVYTKPNSSIRLHALTENLPEDAVICWGYDEFKIASGTAAQGVAVPVKTEDVYVSAYVEIDDKFVVGYAAVVHPWPEMKIVIRGHDAQVNVAYKTQVVFRADTENLPQGARICWKYNGVVQTAEGDVVNVVSKEDYTVQAFIVINNMVYAQSESVQVHVRSTGFFARLIAFFRSLFGTLPVVDPPAKGTS